MSSGDELGGGGSKVKGEDGGGDRVGEVNYEEWSLVRD